jgi:hypothetical protein
MSYHTEKDFKAYSVNDLKSYLKTLKGYKSKLIRKDAESALEFEKRRQAIIGEHGDYYQASKSKKKKEIIDEILVFEKKQPVGDFENYDYELLLKNEKTIGDYVWGKTARGDRITEFTHTIPADQLMVIRNLMEEGIKVGLQKEQESAAAAASVEVEEKPVEVEEKPVEVEEKPVEVEEVEEEKPIQIGQEELTVGADANTIVDVPKEIKKLKKPRVYKVKKGKDLPAAQMFSFDPVKVQGYEERILKGDMSKEERLSNLKEYKDYLKKGLYKKENDEITKRYGEVSKELQELENDIQGMVVMGQRQTTGSMQAVNPEPEVKKMTTKRVPEEVLEQKQESTSLPTSSSSAAPKTAYDVLTSGSTKYKVEEAVSFEDIPYGQNDKSIGDVRKIGIGVYDELAKKDDILPSLSQREKSLKRFADFKWITQGGNNNSVLADMSPFQKIDDMEYKLRYGQTFKIKAKIPFDIKKRPDLVKRCETKYMMKPDFVPVSKIMTVEQPSTPIGFAETAEAASLVRNVLINEKGFDNSKNMEFIPKYEDRPKPSNPFSICTGLQSYYPNEMIEIPDNDPLQKPSIIIHPDTNQIMYV